MLTLEDLKTPKTCTWCPGCGNFGIWAAFKQAAVQAGWDNSNTVMTAGIGCHGHINNFTKLSSFEGLHGRSIPLAIGIKIANDGLNVFAFTGDGDCLAEGGNHFVHAARRNQDITVVLHDNALYGLTTGQTSPRSPCGFKSKSTPFGNTDEPINPLILALAAGATFIARVFSGNIAILTETIIKANKHKGFSVIQVLQPCVTFNKEFTNKFYLENIYKLDDNYNPKDKETAFVKMMEWGAKKIPVGILYQSDRPSCEGQVPVLEKSVLVASLTKKRDIKESLQSYC
ncbi:MAG: hypothetical protein UT67_C0007G0002 [Candidatus Magasanikbacteria bacterium GW2011_GWA2_40_10]|uniref:2-oxoacid ferredoxin oxidoreductase n=1 Tax=Candidatus Magasanikbacteria bacterium GW2011_GWA2_40_10 TaxID=1619037 RepID=A0A0G0Q3R8_9BACT|nr:MAG: hypothetical protein UT67_C0007G0002 [Candidatus Magasanikbacteria bacterium GW2011_GWA2_40_10]